MTWPSTAKDVSGSPIPLAAAVRAEERELDHASILRLDPQPGGNWTLQRMTFDTTSPNGILFSQDERTLYVAQSDYDGVRELRAYPAARR